MTSQYRLRRMSSKVIHNGVTSIEPTAATPSKTTISTSTLVNFALQIANGMEYLSSLNVCYILLVHSIRSN